MPTAHADPATKPALIQLPGSLSRSRTLRSRQFEPVSASIVNLTRFNYIILMSKFQKPPKKLFRCSIVLKIRYTLELLTLR